MPKKEPLYPPLVALREAVHEDLIRKAKLGQKVVVADRNGNPKVYTARYILRRDYLGKRKKLQNFSAL